MQYFKWGILILSSGLLVACGGHKKGYAPQPPQFDLAYASSASSPEHLANIAPAAGSAMAGEYPRYDEARARKLGVKSETARADCSIKDRFDRGDLVAYEWGQNRVGFDIDGVGMDSVEVEEVKLTYSLNLQPIKTRKQKCRRSSSWQGMVGSGYNELVEHDGVAVKQEWRDLKGKIADRAGYFFD